MPVTDDKERVMITLSREELEWVDQMAERFRASRSQVIGKCVRDTKETLEELALLGLTPENYEAFLDKLYKMWNVIGSPFSSLARKKKRT